MILGQMVVTWWRVSITVTVSGKVIENRGSFFHFVY